jgi:hypothetical protein
VKRIQELTKPCGSNVLVGERRSPQALVARHVARQLPEDPATHREAATARRAYTDASTCCLPIQDVRLPVGQPPCGISHATFVEG